MSKTREKAVKKKWTVLLYLAGDNNLDQPGKADIMEMKKVGSTEDVNVVVQFDSAGASASTKRYYVRKGTSLASDEVASLGETNTGDPRVLSSFIDWGVESYGAEHYLLGLWNHGSGWDDSNLFLGGYFSGAMPPIVRKGSVLKPVRKAGADRRALSLRVARAGLKRARRSVFRPTVEKMMTSRAIAFDDQARDYLDNKELKAVLSRAARKIGRKVDVVGFDACLMGMVEIAYQLKETAAFIAASEEEEPGDGWPYDTILKDLAAKPSMTPKDLACLITQNYLASYGQQDNVTFSAMDCSLIDPLVARMDVLATALTAGIGDPATRDALMRARARVQEYTAPYDQYCDLIDLCQLISQDVADAGIASACRDVVTAAGKTIVANGSRGPRTADSHGLAVYFPKKTICSLYAAIDFGRTAWPRFMESYLQAVGRRSLSQMEPGVRGGGAR